MISGEETLMDWEWDLWGPTYLIDESSYYLKPEVGYNFYFGYGFEEDDALNRRCCVHVLRILLTKAETEISELEEEIIYLQGELSWFEDEEWSVICCNTIKEKIDLLEIATRKLKDEDTIDVEVDLPSHKQPVESLKEIFEVLLRKQDHEKNEQVEKIPLNNGGLNDGSNSSENTNDLKDSCKAIQNKKVVEHCKATYKRKYSSLKSKGKGNTSVNANGHSKHPGTEKVASPDMDQKLRDFASEVWLKKKDEIKVDKADTSLCSTLKISGSKSNAVQSLEFKEKCSPDTENCAVTLLLELKDQMVGKAEKMQTKGLAKSISAEDAATENAPHVKKLCVGLPRNFMPRNVENISGYSSIGVVSNRPSMLNLERQKYGICQTKGSLNPSLIVKRSRFIQPMKYDAKAACDDGTVSPKEKEGTRKILVDAESKDSDTQDCLSVNKCCSDSDSTSDAVQPSSSSVIADLSNLRLPELYKLAKEHGLHKYRSMRKGELIGCLSSKIGNG